VIEIACGPRRACWNEDLVGARGVLNMKDLIASWFRGLSWRIGDRIRAGSLGRVRADWEDHCDKISIGVRIGLECLGRH
jgi:hypothetical protein